MTAEEWKDKFFGALHDSIGVCGHCGKRKCAGRASHSVLPTRLSLEQVISASIHMKTTKKGPGNG